MSCRSGDGDESAPRWSELTLLTASRSLVDAWRARASDLDPYAPAAAESWRRAAAELEARLDLPAKGDLLSSVFAALRRDLMADILALRASRRASGGPDASPPVQVTR